MLLTEAQICRNFALNTTGLLPCICIAVIPDSGRKDLVDFNLDD